MSIAASLPDGTLRRVYPDRTEDIRGRGDDVWFDTEIVSRTCSISTTVG